MKNKAACCQSGLLCSNLPAAKAGGLKEKKTELPAAKAGGLKEKKTKLPAAKAGCFAPTCLLPKRAD
jgi:hypothetical protein